MSNGFTFADENEGKDFTLAPAGTHVARCFRVVVLGTFSGEYQGKPKQNRKIRLDFELPTELHDFGNGPEPFFIGVTLNISMYKDSKYRKFLEAWRGKRYTDAEANSGVDVSKFIGHAGLVSVTHDKGKDGKVWANLGTIQPLMKGMECPPAINSPLLWSIFSPVFDQSGFGKLTPWLQSKVKESREWADIHAGPVNTQAPAPEVADDDDDLPF